MTLIIVLLLCYPVLLALLFFGLNRGRVKGLILIGDMLYALGIGVPMILAGYFRWLPEQSFITSLLWTIPILLMVPFLLSKWLNVAKGRESALQAVSFSVALLFFYSTLYVTQFLAIVAVCVGMGFIVLFFVTSARYPYMNSGWLSRLIEETAAEIPQTGRYSTKPVPIEINIGRRFFTGTHGLSLLAKQDRVICRISPHLHRKLGSPNLEAFFSLLCKKIEAMAGSTG
jgi:hypothetical protein